VGEKVSRWIKVVGVMVLSAAAAAGDDDDDDAVHHSFINKRPFSG